MRLGYDTKHEEAKWVECAEAQNGSRLAEDWLTISLQAEALTSLSTYAIVMFS